MKPVEFTTMPLADLSPAPYNPRQISEEALAGLRASLERFGTVQPVIWNRQTGHVVGGHQRIKALQEMGDTETDVVVVDLPEIEEKALNVALNNPAIAGEFTVDIHALIAELTGELPDLAAALRLPDLSKLMDDMLADLNQGTGNTDPDAVPVAPSVPITQRGDLWILGDHRLMCGDSALSGDVRQLMNGERAELMNTDPPYGVAYANEDRPNPGVAKPRVANDALSDESLQSFLESCFHAAAGEALAITAAWYLWHAHLTQGFFAAAAAADVVLHRQIIWVKPVLLLGRGHYHWKHEPCFMGWVRGHQPPDYGEGAGERTQTTVWEVGSVSHAERKEFNHATPKPVALFTVPLVKHTKPGAVCYEPFAGTGPQFIAAEQTSRKCYGMEISPVYCDVIVRRWEEYTGKIATRVSATA